MSCGPPVGETGLAHCQIIPARKINKTKFLNFMSDIKQLKLFFTKMRKKGKGVNGILGE